MMYSEFVAGTGCKDNAHNYKVFQNLEIMYMNSDMSKAEIYEYGKKLVDNSKSEEELSVEAEIKAEIDEQKKRIKEAKRWIEYYKESYDFWKSAGDKEMSAMNKLGMEYYKGEAKQARIRIRELNWILGN